jgi:hypothetical protein
MITDSFDTKTLAKMEVALEWACKTLQKGSDNHDARRYVANRILEHAGAGDHTLGGLTEAGRSAASELARGRDVDVKSPGDAPFSGADPGPVGFDWR